MMKHFIDKCWRVKKNLFAPQMQMIVSAGGVVGKVKRCFENLRKIFLAESLDVAGRAGGWRCMGDNPSGASRPQLAPPCNVSTQNFKMTHLLKLSNVD